MRTRWSNSVLFVLLVGAAIVHQTFGYTGTFANGSLLPSSTSDGASVGSNHARDRERRVDRVGHYRESRKDKSARRSLSARFCCSQDGDTLVSCSGCDFSGDSEIDLSFSGISKIQEDVFQGASGLSGVTEIDFQSNDLGGLPGDLFQRLGSLQEINLANNRITSLPVTIFQGLSDLEELILDFNALEALDKDLFNTSYSNLETIALRGNRLKSIPEGIFDGLTALTQLVLEENDLEEIPEALLKDTSSLFLVRLSSNLLSTIPKDLFNKTSNLQRLFLNQNEIGQLSPDTFRTLAALTRLRLDENKLTHITPGLFNKTTSLDTLNLKDNPGDGLPCPFGTSYTVVHESADTKFCYGIESTPPPTTSPTVTPSVTTTQTASGTTTPSVTASKTTSSSPSASASPTPSTTSSPTGSMTATGTVTSSKSGTPTVTITGTASSTATVTASRSSTARSTTLTSTSTVSQTPSYTSSKTASPSVSATVTASATPSVTSSQTASKTPSNTASPSVSATMTGSGTRTATPSNSASKTATNTASPSVSATMTGSATRTATPSNSASKTPSRTASSSVTASRTATPSKTSSGSATPTSTPSQTGTPSTSATLTPTASVTASVTGTASITSSITPSRSATPSNTASSSSSPTQTATSSATPSISPTSSHTASHTPTSSKTASITPSVSVTSTATDTPSGSPMGTSTASRTATGTTTGTSSPTASSSLTATSTPTSSVTPSHSSTGTASVSATVSASSSASPSSSVTPSYTPSASSSRSASPSSSMTASRTPTSSGSVTPTQSPSNVPLPVNGSEVRVSSCGSEYPFNCVSVSLSSTLDISTQDTLSPLGELPNNTMLWLEVQSTFGMEPVVSFGCHNESTFDSRSVVYSGCDSRFANTRFDLPPFVTLRLDLIRNETCKGRVRRPLCRQLTYWGRWVFSDNAKDLLQSQAVVLDGNVVHDAFRKLESPEMVTLPASVSITLNNEKIISAKQNLNFELNDMVYQNGSTPSLSSNSVYVEINRTTDDAGSLLQRNLSLTVEAGHAWSWDSTPAPYMIPPRDGVNLHNSTVTFSLTLYLNVSEMPVGLQTTYLYVGFFSDASGVPIRQLSVSVTSVVRQAFVLREPGDIRLWSVSDGASLTRFISLGNSGTTPFSWSTQVFAKNGTKTEIPWLEVPNNGSHGETSSHAQVEPTILLRFFPQNTNRKGLLSAWVLVITDSWSGQPIFANGPDEVVISSRTYYWYSIELVITAIFSCLETSERVPIPPLGRHTSRWTVINTERSDIWITWKSVTLFSKHENGSIASSFNSEPKIRNRNLWITPWLTVSPSVVRISPRKSETFYATLEYSSSKLSAPYGSSDNGSDHIFSTPIGFRIESHLGIYLSRDVLLSSGEPHDTELLSLNASFKVGIATPTQSGLVVNESRIPVDDVGYAELELRDEFGTKGALAQLMNEDDRGTSSSIPRVSVALAPVNDAPVRLSFVKESTSEGILESLVMKLTPVKSGTVQLRVMLDGESIQSSPSTFTVVGVNCTGDNEVPTKDETTCLCIAGYRRSSSDECVPCEEGTITAVPSNNEQCTPCSNGQFSEAGASECFECPPTGFECPRGVLRMLDGYWCDICIGSDVSTSSRGVIMERLKQEDQLTMHQCKPSDACAVNSVNLTTECAEGHSGPLCSLCQSEYVKSEENRCLKCDSRETDFALMTLMATAICLAVLSASLWHFREDLQGQAGDIVKVVPAYGLPEGNRSYYESDGEGEQHVSPIATRDDEVSELQELKESPKEAWTPESSREGSSRGGNDSTNDLQSPGKSDHEVSEIKSDYMGASHGNKGLGRLTNGNGGGNHTSSPENDEADKGDVKVGKSLTKSSKDAASPKSVQLAIVLFLDYFQIITIISGMKINPFKNNSQWILEFGRYATANPTSPSSFRCSIPLDSFEISILSMVLPWVMVMMITVAHTFIDFCLPKGSALWTSVARRTIRTSILVLGLIHMSVSSTAIGTFETYDKEIYSSKRLSQDLTIQVGSRQYWIVLLIAGFTCVCFVFGFPLTVLLYFQHRYQRAKGHAEEMAVFEKLISGLRPVQGAFLYPAVETMRKTCLVFVSVFLSRAYEQLFLVTMILLGSYILIFSMKPFRVTALTVAELIKVASAMLTCFFGAVIYSQVEDTRVRGLTSPMIPTGFAIAVQIFVCLVFLATVIYIIPAAYNAVVRKVEPILNAIGAKARAIGVKANEFGAKVKAFLGRCSLPRRPACCDRAKPQSENAADAATGAPTTSELETNDDAQENNMRTPWDNMTAFLQSDDYRKQWSELRELQTRKPPTTTTTQHAYTPNSNWQSTNSKKSNVFSFTGIDETSKGDATQSQRHWDIEEFEDSPSGSVKSNTNENETKFEEEDIGEGWFNSNNVAKQGENGWKESNTSITADGTNRDFANTIRQNVFRRAGARNSIPNIQFSVDTNHDQDASDSSRVDEALDTELADDNTDNEVDGSSFADAIRKHVFHFSSAAPGANNQQSERNKEEHVASKYQEENDASDSSRVDEALDTELADDNTDNDVDGSSFADAIRKHVFQFSSAAPGAKNQQSEKNKEEHVASKYQEENRDASGDEHVEEIVDEADSTTGSHQLSPEGDFVGAIRQYVFGRSTGGPK